MSLRINTNVSALSAHNNLSKTTDAVSKSMEKLSSGFRINRAGDDAAGLSISERMRGQIRGLGQAATNTGDAISMVQTVESNLGQMQNMLQRVRELAVQHQNGSLSTADRTAIGSEATALKDEISRIAGAAKFNGIALFSAQTVSFQVGANDGETITVALQSLSTAITGVTVGGTTALAGIDAAINDISDRRATLGATQNRLEYAVQATKSYQENLVSAESRIRDVDMASEMVNLSKQQILSQAGTAMLAQANQSGQGVLSLLR